MSKISLKTVCYIWPAIYNDANIRARCAFCTVVDTDGAVVDFPWKSGCMDMPDRDNYERDFSMYDPSLPITTSVKNSPVIAGIHGGNRIRCHPKIKNQIDKLQSLARDKKNYWALLAIKGIQSLTSGVTHTDNVFIKDSTAISGLRRFYLVLPGCTATIEKLSNSEFLLWSLDIDDKYSELQRLAQKPGTYRVRKANEIWTTKYVKDGNIKKVKDRVVVITDTGNGDPDESINFAADYIYNARVTGGEHRLTTNGFDMHYTPGEVKIGGLRRLDQAWNAENKSSLNESAVLLAKMMADARDVDGVAWVAEHGGAGIMAQSMKILAKHNIKLENHTYFLCNPTTLQSTVDSLSKELGMTVHGDFSNNNPLHVSELVGGMGVGVGFYSAYKKYKNGGSGKNLTGDILKEFGKLSVVPGTIVSVVSLGLAPTSIAVPAVLAIYGAVAGSADILNKVASTYAPKTHKKASKLLGLK